MLKVMVSVFDAAAQLYVQPFSVVHQGVAIRDFTDQVNRSGSREEPNPLNAHASDFELWLLGTFNDATGLFVAPDGGPVLLVRGKDLLRSV